MDRVYLRDLSVDTIIGVYEWERRLRQTISLNLEMASDIRPAAASDDLRDALNYKAVAKRVVEFVEHSRFQLVEKLAEEVARLVITEFGIAYVRLTLDKPRAVSSARGVGVIVERSAVDYGGADD